MENVREPDIDISSSIDTAKELLLSKPQSFQNLVVKKHNKYKQYHMKYVFLIFISPLLRVGGFVKYVVIFYVMLYFLMEKQVMRALDDKPRKLGQHPWARFSDNLNSNHHKLSVKNKQ